jgi:hypothetical protein
MGVNLVIIGNHSIPFKNKELEDKSKLILRISKSVRN